MPRPPCHQCEFTYDYRPVGQGLFCRGQLRFHERGHERRTFQWVYDCGSENGPSMRGEIDLYRRQLPDPKRLDLLVLSHFDRDHVAGVGRLLNGLRVDRIILPYLAPAQRMMLAGGAGPDDLDYVRFLVSPAEYLATLPGADIGAITFIQPNQEPLPPEDELETTPPDSNQPPDVFWEADHPSKEAFGDDPGMLVQNRTSAGTALTARGQLPMQVSGLWEFAFYNQPRPLLQSELKSRVQPAFEAFYHQPEGRRNYDEFIRQLRCMYRQVFGADASGRNDISLVTYTGPLKRRLRSAHYRCRNHCQYPSTRNGRGPHAGQEQDCNDGSISALYTGDLTFKNGATQAVRRFLGDGRWDRICFLQVPHHGSRHSWDLGQANEWSHDWSVFSAGLNNGHQHPHQEVLDDLRHRNPVLVNEIQGAAWGGIVGWKAR